MLTICTLLWDANKASKNFSSMYDETWVEKLYRGFARNLTIPFDFMCYVDRPRQFREPIMQTLIRGKPYYGSCIQPYELNVPMLLVGLDTVVTGNCDALAAHCLIAPRVALPRAVYQKGTVCNGVALVPAGHSYIYKNWQGQNDMMYMRAQEYDVIDDLFPGEVASYKGHVKENGLKDERIVFFHGKEKPHEINEEWIYKHWR